MKPFLLTHKYYMLILISMLIPLVFGLAWLSLLLTVPFLIMLTGIYLSKGQVARFIIRLLTFIVYCIICRLYIFDIYQVNSGSMEGTLIKGDVLFVNKLAYGPRADATKNNGYTTIKHKDIFIYELFPDYFVVKRCIGLPGDNIRISSDTVFINNHFVSLPENALSQYYLKFNSHSSIKAFVSSIPHSAIDSINIDSNIIIANLAQQDLPNNALHIDQLPIRLLPGKTPYFQTINNLGPIKIPAHQYFMMGDNRPYSEDSRYLGLIPEKEIVGKVAFILYSYSEEGFVWNRLFKNIL